MDVTRQAPTSRGLASPLLPELKQVADHFLVIDNDMQIHARYRDIRMTGGDSDLSQRAAKRPLTYRAVLPQERLLESRSQRYWSWPDGAGSAVLKIKEEIHAKPRCQRKAN